MQAEMQPRVFLGMVAALAVLLAVSLFVETRSVAAGAGWTCPVAVSCPS
jgi:hypothetical protein